MAERKTSLSKKKSTKIEDPFKDSLSESKQKEPTYPTVELIPLYKEEPNCNGEKELIGFYDRKISKKIYNFDQFNKILDFTKLIDNSYGSYYPLHSSMLQFPEYKEVFDETVKNSTPLFQEGEIIVSTNRYSLVPCNQKFQVGTICAFSMTCGINNTKIREIARVMIDLKTNKTFKYLESWFVSIKDYEKLLEEKKQFSKALSNFRKAIKDEMIGAELKYKGKTYQF